MKKNYLLSAFLISVLSYGQTISGFVNNPSFDDGSPVSIPRNNTVDYWRYEGNNATTPATIQTTDVYDGTNALEITNSVVDGEWKNQIYSTTYPFTGDNTNAIEVTVSFWAKTTDTDPDSEDASGDLKLIVRDTGSGSSVDRTERAILTTNTWSNHTITFNTFAAAANYSLQIRFQLGKLDGTTQIDGITTSVSGGATLLSTGPGETLPYEESFNYADGETLSDQTNWSTPVEPYSGFVINPSFEDGSVGTIARYGTLNDWKYGGGQAGNEGHSASIQSSDVHSGDGNNALEVTSVNTGGEWNIRLINTTYAFDGNNTDDIQFTVSFWAKTTDIDPDSENASGDMRILVKDTGSSALGDTTRRINMTTNTWQYFTRTMTFGSATDYSLSLYLEFGKLDGITQIDGITTSVTGGATLGPSTGADDILATTGSLSYSGLKTSKNNMITLDNDSKESLLSLSNQTSGTVYYSFVLKVKEVDDAIAVGDKDSFAGFASAIDGSYSNLGATLWAEKAGDTSYQLGINSGVASSNVQLDTTEYNEDDILFIVVGLDLDNDEAKLWVNPTSDDLANNASIPSETQVATGATLSNVKAFSLHQEYSKVPDLDIDELRVGTSWTDVTPPGITWNGNTDNDWNTSTNWTPQVVPYDTAEAIIPAGLSNYPTSASAVDINSVSLANGSSFIANSTFSGDVTYTRNLNTTNWYLVSSPVTGQDIDSFASAEGLASGTNNNNMGLGSYDNTSSSWIYYQSDASGTGDFALGSGRCIKLASAGDISFTGTMSTDDVSITCTSGFNLVGNPYPSYISLNDVLTNNNANLSQSSVWLWDQASDSYDTFNLASSGIYISPAQGFFVESNGNALSITEAMQSHQSSDSFQRLSNERPEIRLILNDGINVRDTDIYYIEGATTGFDNGYDSTTFGGLANEFDIYTHLVANSNGEDLAIQSLPNTNLETMIIPVGITAAAGEELIISANAVNIPEGLNIYLEDKIDGSFTLLNSTSTFTTTADEDLNGIGRFYIHTTSTALSDNQVSLSNVSMYLVDRNLTITGVHTGNTNVRVYDLLGKEVHNTSFKGTGLNKITMPKNLAIGVYVVKLEAQIESISKKIILN